MSDIPLFSPLTATDYKRIRETLAEAEKAVPYLAALAQLGHAVEGHQQTVDAAQQYLTAVLAQFPEQ